jgi:hypothetical protein
MCKEEGKTVYIVFNPRQGEIEVFRHLKHAKIIAERLGEALVYERELNEVEPVKHECFLALHFIMSGTVDLQVFHRLSEVKERTGKLTTVNITTGLVEEAEFLETSNKTDALHFVNSHAKEKNENESKAGKAPREN